MNEKNASKLKKWISRKYRTKSEVFISGCSVIVKGELDKSEGCNIHTDGIIERCTREFNVCIVSGYNYVVICKFGKEFKDTKDPRIVVYCNKSSKWSKRRFKRTVRDTLRKYQ